MARRTEAFTLIELLVVLAMIGIIFGAVYGTYAAASQSVERWRHRGSLEQQARGLLALMARELRAAYVPAEEHDAEDRAEGEGILEADSEQTAGLSEGEGGLMRVLTDGVMEAGPHEVAWDGRDRASRAVASGVYFYRLEAGEFTETKKMVLLR